jgi:hypothetical protein
MRIIILVTTLLAATVCLAQQIPRKANVIKVSQVTFKQVAMSLLDAGYLFQKIDSNYNTITTEPKEYSRKVGGMIQLNIRVKDSTVIISGYCGLTEGDFNSRPSTALGGKSEIANQGMKGSLMRESFDVMNKFARSLGTDIVYIKED